MVPSAGSARVLTVIIAVAISGQLRAHAQVGDAGASAADPQLTPPELVQYVEASYPPEARAQRLAGIVGLQLTIDADGRVSEAVVIEPAGHGFDEAAREAALRFGFAPARRDGEPIAARIRYRYVFDLEPEPSPPAPPLAVATPAAGSQEPAAAPGAPAAAIEVKVAGSLSEGQRLQQSAEAVNVVDTREAQKQTADLGEVLARTQGVAIRRDGGLGSGERLSLNGLYDNQIRVFMDGVPLELAGYPFGIANVPVDLIERVEVYRGVVPLRFGANALGGAVNLVGDHRYQNRLGAGYQIGSFGTHRATVAGRYRDASSGLTFGGVGFLDIAENDYLVDVRVTDDRGRTEPARLPRFHDAYRAYGGTLELGVVDQPWARQLLLQVFASSFDKELQHNLVMSVPYGEARYGQSVVGSTLRYDVALGSDFDLEVVANYAYRTIDFVDKSMWVYDWRGERVNERRVGGEIEAKRRDNTQWQHGAFGRATLGWTVAPGHIVRASVSPTFTTRTGDERIQLEPTSRDPLTAKRELLTFVSGLEYESTLFEDRLSNVFFVKDYLYMASTEEPLPGGAFRARDVDSHTQGIGDALRFRFTPSLYAKLSYEYATRLPRPDEVFGDGVLVFANLELQPEVSHNANIGPRLELRRTPIGELTVDINAFLRDSDRLVVLLGNDRFFSYQNVYRARGVGLETAVSWVSPGGYASVDGMLTWQDVRNRSEEGTFRDFEGDRIPNRPYLFGSWGARARIPNLPGRDDTLEPFYNGRYVHEFFRSWESQGLRSSKQVVASQVTHSVGVVWSLSRDVVGGSVTLEIDNLTDAKAYDNYGVQRPGRGYYLKLTGEL